MWLSIMGMYEYDPTVMDGLQVPEGLDRDSVINNILLNCAELEIIYPRLETMKLAIKIWSDSNQISWKKLYDTMIAEYNPIWNVDADIVDEVTGLENRDINRSGNGKTTDTKAVKGFNSNTWADAERNTLDGSNTEKIDDDVTRTETRSQRRTGNIGVTATQDLLKKEREIADFNIVDYITNSFKKRFCLMIY